MTNSVKMQYNFSINANDRAVIKDQEPKILWLTGRPAAGKSTIANEIEKKLFFLKKHTYILDGDNLRTGLCNDLGFSPEDRQENIRRVGEVAKLMFDAGIITICSFVSPYRKDRNNIRQMFPKDSFYEIYVNTSYDVCSERDPKNLYKEANKGNVVNFTGITSPYEEPENPDIILEGNSFSPEELSNQVIKKVFPLLKL